MKKTLYASVLASFILFACNNEASDPVEKADSANEVKEDANPQTIQTDSETTEFLVRAADGGLAEVEASRAADGKASHADVKKFASMMINDHTGANAQVKNLAGARNVTLPAGLSDDKKDRINKLGEKSGKDYDKAYMDLMVKDHKETINLFEKALDNSKDAEVKTFISNTLPKLKQHLDSAEAIQKMLK